MWFLMIFNILGGVAGAKLDLVFFFKVGLLWKNQSLQKMSKIWKIIKNHFKYINDSWNYMFPANLSFPAWKMRISAKKFQKNFKKFNFFRPSNWPISAWNRVNWEQSNSKHECIFFQSDSTNRQRKCICLLNYDFWP